MTQKTKQDIDEQLYNEFGYVLPMEDELDLYQFDELIDESYEYGDDEESLEPIGVDNLEAQGTNGLVCIFSPLESDMVEDWNNDTKVQKFIEEKRLFLSEIKYDEWSIYGIEGDKEVKNYIIKNYSF